MFRSNEEVGSVKFAGKLYQGHGPLPPQEGDQEAEDGGLQEEEQEQEGSGGGDKEGGVARRSSRLVRRNTLEANTGGEVGAADFL